MLPTSFQFHKGTIRTEEDSIYDMRLANFNSIKVRLEQRTDFVYYAECEFQFHKGTIRTVLDISHCTCIHISIP